MHLIWSMGDGGAQQVIINYLRDFKDDPDVSMKLCVFTGPTQSKYDKEIADEGYPVEYLNNPKSRINIPILRYPFNRFIARKSWYKAIKKYNPDIVHVHISGLLSVTLFPIIRVGVPVRFDTLHSNPLRYKGLELAYIKKSFNKYGFVPICVTEEQASVAKRHYGIGAYELVRNGIDTKAVANSKIDKVEARNSLGLPIDAFIILGVGRLDPIKNYPLLIESFKKVRQCNEKALLIIAGSGNELDNLKNLAVKLGINEYIYFLGNRTDMNVIYSSADVLAMTSISEAAPLTLIEAQTLGVRCVVSSGVPSENLFTSNARRMKENSLVSEWAEALLDEGYSNEVDGCIEDYDVHNISKQLKSIYLKYWNEYKK